MNNKHRVTSEGLFIASFYPYELVWYAISSADREKCVIFGLPRLRLRLAGQKTGDAASISHMTRPQGEVSSRGSSSVSTIDVATILHVPILGFVASWFLTSSICSTRLKLIPHVLSARLSSLLYLAIIPATVSSIPVTFASIRAMSFFFSVSLNADISSYNSGSCVLTKVDVKI